MAKKSGGATVNIDELMSQLKSSGTGRGAVSATSIMKDIGKLGEKMDVDIGRLLAVVDKSTEDQIKLWDKATGLVSDVVHGNFSKAVGTISSFGDSLNSAMLTGVAVTADIAGTALGIGFDTITYLNQEVAKSKGSIEGAMHTFTDSFTKTLAGLDGPVGKFGRMLGTVLDQAINSIVFMYDDQIKRNKAKQQAMAQLGTKEASGVASEMSGYFRTLGRDKASEWATSLMKIGITKEAGAMGNAIQAGLQLQFEPGEVTGMMNELLAVTGSAQEASDALQTNFRMMQKAAEGTNLPVRELAKNVQEATVGARFMNVDLESVAGVMQGLAANADKLKSIGLDLRLDGGAILGDITNASNKASDALHAFYGTEGGIVGSAVEGWVKSKFGSQFAETLEKTTGGFTAKGGKQGDMMLQRLEVMKKTMADASKGATTAAEKLLIEYKVGKETFDLGEEATRAVVMTSMENLADKVNDPKFANKFESTNSLLGKLRTSGSIQEQLQREIGKLSFKQLGLMINAVSYLDILAASATGLKSEETIAEDFALANKASTDAVKAMADNIKVVQKELVGVMGKTLGKSMMEPLVNLLETLTGGAQIAEKEFKKEVGGYKSWFDHDEGGNPKESDGGTVNFTINGVPNPTELQDKVIDMLKSE